MNASDSNRALLIALVEELPDDSPIIRHLLSLLRKELGPHADNNELYPQIDYLSNQ